MITKSGNHLYYIEILAPQWGDDGSMGTRWQYFAPIRVKSNEMLDDERLHAIKAACDAAFTRYRIVRSSEWTEESYL